MTATSVDLEITALAGHIAAEVHVPLVDLLTDDRFHAPLRDSLVEHHVLVLREAAPTPEQHIALAAIFGNPRPPADQKPRHPDHEEICVFESIGNLPPDESDVILPFLKRHVQRPEFTYRHRWEDGDIVIWDNRSTQHYAINDFEGRREVHRVGFVAEPFES